MSTWNSKKPIKFDVDTGATWAKAEISWQYQDTADILAITTKTDAYSDWGGKQPEKTDTERYDPNSAKALLRTLIDWAETYEGEGTVQKMLEERKNESSTG